MLRIISLTGQPPGSRVTVTGQPVSIGRRGKQVGLSAFAAAVGAFKGCEAAFHRVTDAGGPAFLSLLSENAAAAVKQMPY